MRPRIGIDDGFLYAPQIQRAGVNTVRFNNIFSEQRGKYSCWAATAEMIARNLGVQIRQETFIKEICNSGYTTCPGPPDAIERVLTRCEVSQDGTEYCFEVQRGEQFPDFWLLRDELKAGRPVLVYYAQPGYYSHAVLITSMDYHIEKGAFGDTFYIHSLTLRDPSPDPVNRIAKGKRLILDVPAFADSVTNHWFVSLNYSNPLMALLNASSYRTEAYPSW